MSERNVRTILHIAGTEFKRWLRSSRSIILGVMLIFVHMQIIVTLQDCTSKTGLPVSVPEAFVALGKFWKHCPDSSGTVSGFDVRFSAKERY